jgi:hypothetical protein
MSHATEMLENHPVESDVDERALAAAIEACLDAAMSATTCADACLAEENAAAMARCIRASLDCADVCATTARILSRVSETDWRVVRALIEATAMAAHACAEECERWANEHAHCRICAEACRRAEEDCAGMLDAVSDVQ